MKANRIIIKLENMHDKFDIDASQTYHAYFLCIFYLFKFLIN